MTTRGTDSAEQRAQTKRHDEGFTLLEVLVALAIMGLSFGVVFAIFSQSVARLHANAGEAQARALAQSLLAQSSVAPPDDAVGTAPGGLVWRIRVAPYGSQDDRKSWPEDLAKVTVSVSWPGGANGNMLSLTTLRLRPRETSP